MKSIQENDISYHIIGHALKVHRKLGPGLLENVYKQCLGYELEKFGFSVQRELALPVVYEEVKLECGYRLDLVVEEKVVIEVKSVEALNDVFLAQILTYLKLGDYRLGLLINFNAVYLKDGIRRVVNNL